MGAWRYRLELKDIWKKYDEGELSVSQAGRAVAKRISKLACYEKEKPYLEPIVKRFAKAKSEAAFNFTLNLLYDWGDTALDAFWNGEKKCWIATF